MKNYRDDDSQENYNHYRDRERFHENLNDQDRWNPRNHTPNYRRNASQHRYQDRSNPYEPTNGSRYYGDDELHDFRDSGRFDFPRNREEEGNRRHFSQEHNYSQTYRDRNHRQFNNDYDSNQRGTRSGGGYRGVGPEGYSRSDERIKDDVCDRLCDDDDINSEKIRVTVEGGEVHLQGTVQDRQTKRMAENCCENISGVKDVINELRVKSDNVHSIKKKNQESSEDDSESTFSTKGKKRARG